jgi:hypothetical protein
MISRRTTRLMRQKSCNQALLGSIYQVRLLICHFFHGFWYMLTRCDLTLDRLLRTASVTIHGRRAHRMSCIYKSLRTSYTGSTIHGWLLPIPRATIQRGRNQIESVRNNHVSSLFRGRTNDTLSDSLCSIHRCFLRYSVVVLWSHSLRRQIAFWIRDRSFFRLNPMKIV